MKRMTPKSVNLDVNLRCDKVYPSLSYDKSVKNLKTIGLKLSKEQALQLARLLLVGSQDWEWMDLTAYRYSQRKSDETYHITVTSKN